MFARTCPDGAGTAYRVVTRRRCWTVERGVPTYAGRPLSTAVLVHLRTGLFQSRVPEGR
ncbi:conserved hypothetical protein [Streptomyces clavuligerus]|uniref:Uncharacterized protein n=1 Tax=Streptomyces clavuligerus TaxID=1901 RepID=Q6TMQ5_STRCL|nr:hypothetical protein pSCL2.6.A8.14 [Streptomyces clavuligerus]EDY48716.1 conserved hypothetical protein [Streptomyces clavuligerus]